jgi:hypothetical protein
VRIYAVQFDLLVGR